MHQDFVQDLQIICNKHVVSWYDWWGKLEEGQLGFKKNNELSKVTLLCKRNVRETRDNITKVSRILEIQEIQII